jgi:hypothetical protein
MKSRNLPLAISIVFCLAACKGNDRPSESSSNHPAATVFDKLVGTWLQSDNPSFERWRKKNDSTFESDVFSIKGKDTTWNEHATIYRENGHWVFENTVRDQNGGAAVKFGSMLLTDTEVQFANPTHDFPTDIHYSLIGTDSIHAFIIGPGKGAKRDTIPFNYHRVN